MSVFNWIEQFRLEDLTPPPPTHPKPPLSREELRHVSELSLWAGQLLLQYGAESAQIEETVHHIGTALGCNWLDIFISPNAVVVTASSGEEFRTKVRRVTSIGVNFQIVAAIHRLHQAVINGEIDRFGVERELRRISDQPHHYSRWLTMVAVGLACAAFSRLFGADLPVFLVTLFAAAMATFVRQELVRRRFNMLLTVTATAFTAGLCGSVAPVLHIGAQPNLALVAGVLLLVPGIHLINAGQDLLKGYMVTGITRGVTGMLITLAIAAGLTFAMLVMGVNGL